MERNSFLLKQMANMCLLSVRLLFLCKPRTKWLLFLVLVHCCAHKINFVVKSLSTLSIMQALENLLQSFHSYFVEVTKKCLSCKSCELSWTLKIKKRSSNIKSNWTSMLSPCKHVVDYNTLIIKIWEDHVESEATRSNVQKVLNVKLIFSLHCIMLLMLLFELAHSLIKYAIGKDVYINDFVETIRMCKFKLYEMCNDFEYKFNVEVFKTFHSFLAKKPWWIGLWFLFNHPLVMMIGVLQSSMLTKF